MDLRVKRTRKMLRDALWDAIMEKGMEGLSVSELCQRAMINRATFYRHYEDINDLLLRGLDEIFDEIYALGDPALSAEQLEGLVMTAPPRNFVLFLDFIGKRADFFRLMLSEQGIPAFAIRLRHYLEDMIRRRLEAARKAQAVPLLPLEIVTAGWAGQMTGVVQWWLENRPGIPAPDIALYLVGLLNYGIYKSVNIPAPEIGFSLATELQEAVERFNSLRSQ